MINVTPHGYRIFLEGITQTVDKLHLYTEAGELQGHGWSFGLG